MSEEPKKIWVNKTFQVKQYEPVQLYAEMYLIPFSTEDGNKACYRNEEGLEIASEEDAYLMLLQMIHRVWDKYREMLKQRREENSE